ncbi:nitrogen fixation protein NifZ [Beijerinckia indica]|uniref:NifZ family protein n=1 Tax=Beijerinckia indica subsp. indica (strain ATCC 9039 / DSM 1715 / NCIMB 8712) TaxID=395963 RepID=B2IE31_BEII9|nr:NifZ family protein [Beijerinckia indica subsp. indica ATCC 9039]
MEPGGGHPPRFQWGQRVQATEDLYNDGSYPDQPLDALLVKEGDLGEIVNVGVISETNRPLYLVEFDGQRLVVGCLEEELAPV